MNGLLSFNQFSDGDIDMTTLNNHAQAGRSPSADEAIQQSWAAAFQRNDAVADVGATHSANQPKPSQEQLAVDATWDRAFSADQQRA